MPLEIACFTPSSAISAAQAGADRIELCANYAGGGVTPDIHSLLAIRKEVGRDVLINVMIRPRAGDFVYSTKEMEAMRHDIALFTPLASGFVFGILDANGRVDVARNSELVDIAAPLPCTFHRAVDEVGDLEGAVEMVVGCGFKSVLTSGGCRSAGEGVGRLKGLQERFGKRIELIVGGGIRCRNVVEVKKGIGAEWMHSAAITGTGEEVDPEEVKRIKDALAKEVNHCDGDQEMAD
ncbi:copper homeostasis protein cutC [Parastagonospora nodorum]|nr:copper homeostasis protein cutC [Parastagonospora nodorum]KAH4819553.1 copper homeostasis protein cutC [Parastagonospora nodorum]KAH5267997.1 copper homeostasis protein cutC [Parastagonospora nodorum]KAH5581294.1 copper homeostasis protein cutC [Parastagonospora nodorum]KAH6263403.1 copper homeostasis protein cutC [Parastagonospora nodorum]